MSVTTAIPVKLSISEEVPAFVAKRGLEPYFPSLVNILERMFADATKVTVEVHHDPEVEGLSWLIFDVYTPMDSSEQVQAATTEWFRRTAAVCPSHLLTEFSLSIWRS